MLVCQALPDTYLRVCEVIDSTTAEMWSGIPGFLGYIEFINSPGESWTPGQVPPHRGTPQAHMHNILAVNKHPSCGFGFLPGMMMDRRRRGTALESSCGAYFMSLSCIMMSACLGARRGP